MSTPLYRSAPLRRNLRQAYAVFSDRVHLPSKLASGGFTILAEDILDVQLRPPFVIGDWFRRAYPLKQLSRTLKLDLADLYTHVVITRNEGTFLHLRFVPDDPAAFVAAVLSILPTPDVAPAP